MKRVYRTKGTRLLGDRPADELIARTRGDGPGFSGEHRQVHAGLSLLHSPGYLKQEELSIDNEELDEVIKQGKTVIYLLVDGELKGAIALADMVRDESREAISTLQGMGIRCMMLTDSFLLNPGPKGRGCLDWFENWA